MPIAVNTAISFSAISPSDKNFGTRPNEAPTEPKEVTGKAIASGLLNPNKGDNINCNFLLSREVPLFLHMLHLYIFH